MEATHMGDMHVQNGGLRWIGQLEDKGPKPEFSISPNQLRLLVEFAQENDGAGIRVRDEGATYLTAIASDADGETIAEKTLFYLG